MTASWKTLKFFRRNCSTCRRYPFASSFAGTSTISACVALVGTFVFDIFTSCCIVPWTCSIPLVLFGTSMGLSCWTPTRIETVFCSMCHTNPKSGDSSGMTLGVLSETLLHLEITAHICAKKQVFPLQKSNIFDYFQRKLVYSKYFSYLCALKKWRV